MTKKIKVETSALVVEIDPARFVDSRVQIDMGRIERLDAKRDKTDADTMKMLSVYSHMVDVMFGDDADHIMDELADANGGVLDSQTWADFFAEVMAGAAVKNS